MHLMRKHGDLLFARVTIAILILTFACTDGAVNNLNEYITVSPDDLVIDVGADTVNVVFSDKLGVVVGENDLFGFFSLIS
ncbi:hypothetical protein FXO38_25474 [Capsicum annuum]|nr:hypothetical protein FXO38_25474 [Capsicum annuum]